MTGEIETFSHMLKTALGERLLIGADTFLEMVAEDCVMEFPYAPPGLPDRLEGAAKIANHLGQLANLIAFDRIGKPTVHTTSDPDIVIAEFLGFGSGVQTGEPYEQRYISVITTRGGRIVHYRDYWNPLAVLRTLRGEGAVDVFDAGVHYHA